MTAATITVGWQARLYPTAEQATRLNQWAGSLRYLWNRLLERETAQYAADKTFLWRKQLQPLAVGMKREAGLEWLADLPAHAVLDTAARLDGALRTMVEEKRRAKAAGRKPRKIGFPKPKKKFVREAGIYVVGQATEFERREVEHPVRGVENSPRAVRLPKLGRVRLRGGRLPEGRLIGGRVMRDGDRWMLSVQIETPRPEPLPSSDVVIGVDLGLARLATIADGETIQRVEAPKPYRKALKRLKRLQRTQDRRKKGSNRRKAAAKRVTALHRDIRNKRKDFAHQLSHHLTAKGGVLTVETLNIRGMLRGLRLAMSVADAAMGQVLRYVRHKADWRGRTLVAADPFFPSSQVCCVCGELHPEMRDLKRRVLRCACGNVIDRDDNAATNLRRYGEDVVTGASARTRGETGEQAAGMSPPPVPVDEPRMLVSVGHESDHESQ